MVESTSSGPTPSTGRQVLLSLNVDHVATLRQARKAPYPDPVEAAQLAEEAGVGGITVHLREDRRHIQDHDLERLKKSIRGKLNLEIAGTTEMLEVAESVLPDQVTLVPERPDEITTEGGLDLTTQSSRIQRAASTLTQAGIRVSVFLDPTPEQVEAASKLRDVVGFEINTDVYTRAPAESSATELAEIAQVAALGAEAGLEVYAGHGLTVANVTSVAKIPQILELNIGHSIVSRAVLIGIPAAVAEMLRAIHLP